MEANSAEKNVRYVEGEVIILWNDINIKLCRSVVDTVKKYVQYGSEDLEAGGVLIARENIENNNLIIEFTTEPMANDIRKRYRFYRQDQGHINLYNNLFNRSGSIYMYAGEWHTHPESRPHYSMMDKCNWKKIAKQSPERDYYHLIAGTGYICIWIFTKKKEIREIASIRWENMYEKNN